MSQIKRALEKAKAERLSLVSRSQIREQQSEANEKDKKPIQYSRTRVVKVPVEELLKRKLVVLEERNPLSDMFKRLRTRLFRETRPKKWNIIQVSGFDPSEGKTLVAVNLAISIAQETRQTTLLVDLDFRNPSVGRVLGLSPKVPGLKSYFFDGIPLKDLFVNPGIPRLTVLTAGGHVSQSTELVGSPKMENLIKELKHRYDDRYVILDTPGVGTCSDPLVIAEYVDTILLIARLDHTSQKSIKAAMAHIPKEKILGVVLNDVSSDDLMASY